MVLIIFGMEVLLSYRIDKTLQATTPFENWDSKTIHHHLQTNTPTVVCMWSMWSSSQKDTTFTCETLCSSHCHETQQENPEIKQCTIMATVMMFMPYAADLNLLTDGGHKMYLDMSRAFLDDEDWYDGTKIKIHAFMCKAKQHIKCYSLKQSNLIPVGGTPKTLLDSYGEHHCKQSLTRQK